MPQTFFLSGFSEISRQFPESTRKVRITLSRFYGPDADTLTVISAIYRTAGGLLRIYGLDQIIRTDLQAASIPAASYLLRLEDTEAPASYFLTSFSAIHTPPTFTGDAEAWSASHFLSEASVIRLPCHFALPLAVTYWSTVSGLGEITVLHSGPQIVHVTGDGRKMEFLFLPDNSATWTVFRFRNCFGALEYAAFPGVTSRQPAQESTTATVAGVERRFDTHITDSITLEAAALPLYAAQQAAALIHSHEVWIMEDYRSPTSRSIPVIIEDVSGDIADSPEELCSIKIKYRDARK